MKPYLNTRRAFTLIELLVVISIIGMLASVVLVALQGAKDKGAQAAALQFATTNYHSYGASAYAYWNFDEASGNALDQSGNNRNLLPYLSGSPSGSFARSSVVKPNTSASSLALTSGGVYGVAPISAQGITMNAFTLSTWVYFTSLPASSAYPLVLNNSGFGSHIEYNSTNKNLQCVGWDDFNDATIPLGAIQANKWYQVTCSFNGSGSSAKVAGYMNGKLVSTLAEPFFTGDPVVEIDVGAWNSVGSPTFSGYMDDTAVYSQALADSEVEQIYAMQAPEHGLALK